jgi:hypothetical protein
MLFSSLTLNLKISDTLALANSAAKHMVKEGVYKDEDAYFAEHPVDDLSTHIRMLLDPGESPFGIEILDSNCEVWDTDPAADEDQPCL